MRNEYEGRLITIEGIDRSGKSTLAESLSNEISDSELTQEPSNGKYGRIIRDELQVEDDPTMSDFFMFLADRSDHCESLIGPKLDSGTDVICDRYNLSTFAYQTPIVERHMDKQNPVKYIYEVMKEWVIEPDITIYIDIPVYEAMKRIDDDSDRYEKKEYLEAARGVYQTFSESKENVVGIGGMQSEEEILQEALEAIENA